MEIEVRGHSGCQIDIVNQDGQIYVYKSTSDPQYIKRLALQAKKQQKACSVGYQHFHVPYIYELRESADKTSIKMQYVYSKNFIEFFEQAGFEQVDYLTAVLINFVEYEINKCKTQVVSSSIFREKYAEIRNKIKNNPIYIEDNDITDIMDRSQTVFDSLKEMTFPVGTCHGDLTFSNILFNGNNYYLIDFLDSFIDTPLQDIVKIRQDTLYRWSQLMYTKPYDAVRLRIICEKIDSEIDSYFHQKYDWYRNNYHTLQLMNILRILPYTHEKNIANYLQNILNSLLNEIL